MPIGHKETGDFWSPVSFTGGANTKAQSPSGAWAAEDSQIGFSELDNNFFRALPPNRPECNSIGATDTLPL